MSRGSAIVLWYNDDRNGPMLLVGKESIYVNDLLKNPDFESKFGDLIRDYEIFDTSSLIGMSESKQLIEAKNMFSKRTVNLESKLGLGIIKFDTPVKTEHGYTVNFRYLPKSFKRGIIKGQKEGTEDPLHTILREVGEEIGINISEKEQAKIVPLGNCHNYTTYSLDITRGARDIFIKRFQERTQAKSGEVYEFSFKTLAEINAIITAFNLPSKCAIELFTKKGYSEKSISRKGGKSRKNKSNRQNHKNNKSKRQIHKNNKSKRQN